MLKRIFSDLPLFLSTIAGNIFLFASFNAYSAAYQIFGNLAYSNPASLNQVKNSELIIGTAIPTTQYTFTGSDGPYSGSATSNQTNILPYGRLAWRLTPVLTAGIDITHPALTYFRFPDVSILHSSVVDLIIFGTDYSPKISYQITPKLALGAGVNANNLSDFQFNFALPPYGKVKNSGDSWGYGWNAGLSYMLTPVTIFNLSYYSEIDQNNIPGKSTWGPFTTSDKINGVLPATYTANLIQFLSADWALSGTLRYIQWSKENNLTITNSALAGGKTLVLPLNYFDTWSGQLAAQYQLNKKLALKAAIEYQSSPQSITYRTVALPADDMWILGGGLEYAITKKISTKLVYEHAFSYPKINTAGLVGRTVGQADINTDVVDLSLKFDI